MVQNLEDTEVGWHAGDGGSGPGNGTTIAIEIIMDGSGSKEALPSSRYISASSSREQLVIFGSAFLLRQ